MTVQSTILSGLATIFIMFIGWLVFAWIKSRYVDSYYEVRKINKKLRKYKQEGEYALVIEEDEYSLYISPDGSKIKEFGKRDFSEIDLISLMEAKEKCNHRQFETLIKLINDLI